MAAGSARVERRSSAVDRVLVVVLGAWILWTFLATVVNGRTVAEGAGYLVLPIVLGAGWQLGRLCARGFRGPVLPAVATVLALSVLVSPLYANAQGAAGVQLVALAGLMASAMLHGGREAFRSNQIAPRAMVAIVFTVTAGVLGMVLAARTQAASILVVVVAALVALALIRPVGSSRRVSVGGGLAAVGGALAVVLVLSRMRVWPSWLAESESLSWARQMLWRDAFELWQENPVLGGGPGSFFEHSAMARSEPHLYAAHSSILQAGAELGIVGAALFLAILVCGALVATQGDRARGLIGVAAWCALAVHSMIDHLYEFPIVVLLAGLVIGWAGSRTRPRESAPPSRERTVT